MRTEGLKIKQIQIQWWRTSLGEEEIQHIADSIRKEHISQGEVTVEFESRFAQMIKMPYAVATTNGSNALFLTLLALGIGANDEVIVPNRTFIATAHAALLTGAKVVLADTIPELPLISPEEIRKKITPRTKVIIPVHLNGRSADMEEINNIAKKHGLIVLEDACQAFCSVNNMGYLGTQSVAGCFSLSMAKLICTGQGGVIVTKDKKLYEKLKLMRTHGVADTFADTEYKYLGFNFRFTDIAASIGIEQLLRMPGRIEHVKKIYIKYESHIKKLSSIKIVPVKVSSGEIPIYAEVLCRERNVLRDFLSRNGIITRPSLPNLNLSPHLQNNGRFPNSNIFHEQGLCLPCGPAQPLENIDDVIEVLSLYERNKSDK